jgi:cell division protein FtsI (penicillin-binding protein 3)
MADDRNDWQRQRRVASAPKRSYRGRYYFVIALLLIAVISLIWRLVDLTVLKRAFLQGQGDARTIRTVTTPAYRGMILDRNGEPLAISTPVDSIWVNPKDFSATRADFAALATLLNLSKADLRARISKAGDREFVYLKRGVDPKLGDAVKALKIPGIYLQPEFRRYYPQGEVTAHVLGFTNVDDHGQEGLELAYDQWLNGEPGLKRVLKDRLGRTIEDMDVLKAPRPGQNLYLSIDSHLQYFAYQELQAGIQKYQATSGSAVILDVKTGEILAMVNWPSYNPNNRPDAHDGRYRNRAVTDTFEPGSTIKSFSMASALASGKYFVNSRIDTSPGVIYIAGNKVDDDKHNNGIIDLTTILKVSSNVGMSKITVSLPPQNLWNMLHNVGFGQITNSGFPGERSGLLPNYRVWNPFVLATMSFGYGLNVTPLQLTQAYAILAANGIKRPVTFIRLNEPLPAEQVMDPKVAQDIRVMLESVLAQGGTAPLARVPGYRVTGKTGTAHIVGPHGYEKNHYNSIFVGMAPASNPRLVVAVVLHDPQGKQYFGGYTAGPIFSRIMGEALRVLNVPPDDINSKPIPVPADTTPPPGMTD